MTAHGSKQLNQISFKSELARKATHMTALSIPGSYYILSLDKVTMLYIMVPITILMILIDLSRLRNWLFWRGFARKIIQPIIREHEIAGDFTGATYILLSVCLTVALYSKPVAIAALAFIIVGDTFAALVGRKFGRHKFRNKSFEGSLSCLLGTIIVAIVVASLNLNPPLGLYVALFGAVVATVVEALSFEIDDNVSVPILSGLAMTLFISISF